MTTLDELYALADKNGIQVFCCDLPKSRCLAVMDDEGFCSIGIDPMYIETYSDEAELLAHELGHCITGSFYNFSSPFEVRQKQENRADYWMVNRLAPANRISELMKKGLCEPWQLAEALDVSQPLLEKAIRLYSSKSML